MKKASAAFLLFFISTMSAQGQAVSYESGGSLKHICEDDAAFNGGKCVGYITAIADLYRYISSPGTTICIPSETTTDQIVSVVRTHLSEKSDGLDHPAFPVVAAALVDAFPCR